MTDVKVGLTPQQAQKLLEENGENVLESGESTHIAAMFFSQFKDLMIIILAVATLLSVLMGEGREAITIIAIVLLNAFMGFIQEYRTEKTLSALKAMSAPNAQVIRGGVHQSVPAAHLVVGDAILIEAGDRVPADAQLINASNLQIDEAILTGESVPVAKSEGTTIMMGTTVAAGHGTAVVTATAMATEMGKIAGLLKNAEEEKTPLQIKLQQLGKFVAIACIVICLAVSGIGYLQGESFLNMLLTGISLAVAAIPEGMPAIVTIVLALSVGRILKKGAIIRRLHAVETLGCAGVICTDKTGTITENKMTVKEIYCGGHHLSVSGDGYRVGGTFSENGRYFTPRGNELFSRLCSCAVLCSTAQITKEGDMYRPNGDPTEVALLVAAAKAGFEQNVLQKKWQLIEDFPFDSQRKLMSVHMKSRSGPVLFVKGAPDVLLKRCTSIAAPGGSRPLTARDKEDLTFICKTMAANALRVLGFAESSTPSSGENNLIFLGFMGMIDPPRAEVASAVRRCRRAGIKPVMITGDHADTAAAIAKQTGILRLGDRIITGDELEEMTDATLAARCMSTAVYARVSPTHKLRIVKAYKAAGQIVAMTGDGVNDAPAVKEADIGVAMGISGTDVTKEASAVIILDDNFATIVSAVEEGRIIYQNIRRFIRYLLTGNLGEVSSMLFAMLMGLPMALVPIQILMVNLLTDGLPAIALGMEPPAGDIMNRPPRPKNQGLFAEGLMTMILVRGFLLGVAISGTYWLVLQMGASLIVARSAAFLSMVLSQMIHIFECRGNGLHFSDNWCLFFATLASVAITLATVYVPFLQPIFCTEAVTGSFLIPVIGGMLLGPVATSVLRAFKHWALR
ncbi:MAG: cation-translocating P-type ATPase [Oscillospiraceae bacterium]|nr:cation-translocating P-type ATPase [Oscillospiraceae bacterium]